ncbi:MAG: ATP-binding protein [Thermoplasmatales archaeon]|nr:ATP-binding protein [Thermoplasmatales archaeon]
MEEIGEIVEGTTSYFIFKAIKEIKKLDYVCVFHENKILSQIWEIFNRSDGTFAKANIIGSTEERYMVRTPFSVGEKVYRADEETIKKIIGIENEGIYIGILKDMNIKVFLSPETLIQKHICILAKSGSGKSYTMGVIIEEFIKKGDAILIIDPHGEYTSLRHPNFEEINAMSKFEVSPKSYAKNVFEYSPVCSNNREAIPLLLDEVNLSFQDLLYLFPEATQIQKGLLYEAWKNASEKRIYTMEDILEEIKEAKSSAKWGLINQMEQIMAMGIFSKYYTPLDEIVKKGKCSIINMRGVPPYIQEMLVSILLTRIFEERKNNSIPPLLVVIEEAHRYCPERGQGKSIASSIIKNIASEGRKFGIGLAILTQRPARIDKNVISQCNTHIILKTTNPNDLKAITSSVEGLDSSSSNEIQTLPIGVAIVAGMPLACPIFVEIRTRETRHGGK